jgi:cytochrome c oxidase assembly protein subunit 17
MLFAKSDNPQKECVSIVAQYKSCMAGYGFVVP